MWELFFWGGGGGSGGIWTQIWRYQKATASSIICSFDAVRHHLCHILYTKQWVLLPWAYSPQNLSFSQPYLVWINGDVVMKKLSVWIVKGRKELPLPPPSVIWAQKVKILRAHPRGLQKDVVHLGWPIAPSYMSPNAGEGGSCEVSANEYSCTQEPK